MDRRGRGQSQKQHTRFTLPTFQPSLPRDGFDVVVEHTGADTWPGSIAALKNNGRLVTCGATSGFDARTDLRQVFFRHLTLLGSCMGSKAELLEAMKFVAQGKIRAVVDRVFPLSEARQAHELMENRGQFGKIVLKPQI